MLDKVSTVIGCFTICCHWLFHNLLPLVVSQSAAIGCFTTCCHWLFHRLRQQFKQLLVENHNVGPGKSLNEVMIFFIGRECFTNLSEDDKQQVRTSRLTLRTDSMEIFSRCYA